MLGTLRNGSLLGLLGRAWAAHLVLPEQLLDEVVRVSGEKTCSAAVTVAMEEFVRRARARQILRLRGSAAWEGDLAVVREDKRPLRAPRKAR